MQAALSRFGSTRGALLCAVILATPLPLFAAQIGGRVFLDGNRNAALNTGEPGLQSITVRLTWAGPDGNFVTSGDNQTFTQVTDASGNFNFTSLQAGNHRVDLDNVTLPAGLAVLAGTVDPRTFSGVTASQVINDAHYPVVSSGLNATVWTINEADPGASLPRSGSGSPRLYCFSNYGTHTPENQFLDYGQLVWRDTFGIIQFFAGGDNTNAESLAIDTRSGDAYIVVNPAAGGFTVPVLFKVNLWALAPRAAQVEVIRIGEVRNAGGVAAPSIEAMAFDESSNTLYAVNEEGDTANDPDRLLQINLQTAQWTARGLIEEAGGAGYSLTHIDGLEVVPNYNAAGQVAGGTLFGYDQEDNDLYQINSADGSIATIINTVTNNSTGIGAIGWDERYGHLISLDNTLDHLATIPLDGTAPILISTYFEQGLSNDDTINNLQGAGFYLRGAYPLAAIGNHVWRDANGNGQWDEDETPISGVQVQLFFDSNNDGDFNDSGEDVPYAGTSTNAQGFYEFSGLQAGRFRVGLPPSNFGPGQPLATFSLSSPVTDSADNHEDADDNGIQTAKGQPVMSPAILLSEGEIDHTVDFGMMGLDYGDAPSPYPVLFASGGAWHPAAGPALGADRDAEPDGQPSTNATADGTDEDGVFVPPLQAGANNNITVIATGPARLDAWVDWNRDGDWNDAGERIANSFLLAGGNNTLTVPAPPGLVLGTSFARFRISTAGGLTAGGGAPDGEVEDYEVDFFPPGSISGSVLLDLDNDDIGDEGIPDVTLTLLDAAGAPVDGNPGSPGVQEVTVVTDSEGHYSFTGLASGFYGVAETQPDFHVSVSDSDGGNPNRIDAIFVNPGGDIGGNNFVEEQLGLIEGRVLVDTDQDGIGDEPVEGVTVDLFSDPDGDGDPADGLPVDTTVTDATGLYFFNDLTPGGYVVIETQPENYFTAGDGDTTDEEDDAPNIFQDDNLIPVAVGTGEMDDGNHFIEVNPGSISGRVAVDADGDGIGDNSVEAAVYLFTDPDNDGDPGGGDLVNIVMSDSVTGMYSFDGLPPGDYVVLEIQPDGLFSSRDGDSTNGADDLANANPTDDLIPVSIVPGESDSGNDFTEVYPGTISGRAAIDTNNDGAGDIPLADISMTLLSDPNGDGNPGDGEPVASVQTAVDGVYVFENLPAGDYVVMEAQPEGVFSAADVDSTDGSDDAPNANPKDDLIPVSLLPGESDNGNDFVEEYPGSISGTVTLDSDNNGTGDIELAEVVVSLFTDPNGDGDPEDGDFTASTLTDLDGVYQFEGLRPGDYVVRETQPNGLYSASDGDSTAGTDDAPNGNPEDDLIPVSINGGESDDGNDFTEEFPGSISGRVLLDTNHDATGEDGIAGAVIHLYSDPNGDGNPDDGGSVDSTLTDEDGVYSFNNVQSGNYVVVEIQPDLYFTESDGDNTDPLDDAINVSVTDNRIPVFILPGESDHSNDFVEELPATISGAVLVDNDNDDIGDEPLGENIAILLYSDPDGDGDPADGTFVAITVTDSNGFFQFSTLVPGSYVIEEQEPGGVFTVTDTGFAGDTNDAANVSGVDELIPVTVFGGESDSGNFFVEERPGTISGQVTADTDSDGLGDTPIQSVFIVLLDENGEFLDSDLETLDLQPVFTMTDVNGAYAFADFRPGTYGVYEIQPNEYLNLSDADGGDPDEIFPIVVQGGFTSNGNDFLEELPGSISGSVLQDIDNDGIGDVGMPDVDVSLYSDPDGDGDPEDGMLMASMPTGLDGDYAFNGLRAGSYVVTETQPAGYYSTLDVDSTDGLDDTPNTDPADDLIPVSIIPGENDNGNEFIEELPGSIYGYVLTDVDNDGAGDAGIADVLVSLHTDPDGDGDPEDGEIIDTALTNEDGAYAFTGLQSGAYVVVETQPAGYFTHTDGDNTDGLDDALNASPTDDLIPVTIHPEEDDDGNDFIEKRPGHLSGGVFADHDNDDDGDAPLEGVTITLYSDPNGDGDPDDGQHIADTATAADGLFSFTGLVPGNYVLVETQPAGYFSAADFDLTPDANDAPNLSGTDDLLPVVVTAEFTDDGNQFIEELPGSISGRVRADTNNDDAGDTPIENVILVLLDGNGDVFDGHPETPDVQPVFVQTDVDGAYTFLDLPPGNYGVLEFQPDGYLSVTDSDGGNPDEIRPVTVEGGVANTGNDFIEEQPGSFSGTVFSDDNNDDTGDTGIEGVTVTLLDMSGNPMDGDSETPGIQFITNQTSPEGTYSFTDLPPGIYGITETQPPGWLSVGDRDGGNPDRIYPISITAGADNSGNDFIEERSVAIGGFIYADTNANGFLDGGETAAPAVMVRLLFDANNDGDLDDDGEDSPVQSAPSIGGIYNFTNLPPGNYQVVIPTPPAGLQLSSPNTDTADNGQDNDDNGTQPVMAGPTLSPVINLLAGTEPDVDIDGSDVDADTTVDFAFTSPNATNWIAWQNLHPLGGQNGPNDNPEGDLNENLVEFAFGYDPLNGVAKNAIGLRGFSLRQDGGGGFYAEVIRPIGLTGMAYKIEFGSPLNSVMGWMPNRPDMIVPVTTNIGGGFEAVRWLNLESLPIFDNHQGFVRIRVEETGLGLVAFSEVQGWVERQVETQSQTYSNPFLKHEIFSATGDAGSPPNAIDVSGSAANVNVAGLFAGAAGLYVEVLDGAQEGHRFAVDTAASGEDTIALIPGDPMNTVSPIPDLSGAPIAVREMWRFGEIFPTNFFQSGGDLNSADNILTFNAATQSWTTYFLADLGPFGIYWINGADMSGPPPANQDDRTIGPAEGLFLHRRGEALSLPMLGVVRANDFWCPLVAGNNLIGAGYAMEQTYIERGLTLAAGFDGDTDIRKADQAIFWKGDRNPGQVSYSTFFLLDAGPPWQRWVSAGDSFITPVDNEYAFRPGHAFFLKRSAPLHWKVTLPWTTP